MCKALVIPDLLLEDGQAIMMGDGMVAVIQIDPSVPKGRPGRQNCVILSREDVTAILAALS